MTRWSMMLQDAARTQTFSLKLSMSGKKSKIGTLNYLKGNPLNAWQLEVDGVLPTQAVITSEYSQMMEFRRLSSVRQHRS